MADSKRPREAWNTRMGVILAVTGSAVGLGNFLRFPGLAAKYEGGAFMIPYFVALLLLGLPIAWVEWSMGRAGGNRGFNSIPGILRSLWPKNRLAPYFGGLGLLVPVGIYMYYVYIEAWCLGYAIYFATGMMDKGTDKKAYTDFFEQFTGQNAHGDVFNFTNGWYNSVALFVIICFAANFFLIYRGLSKGIEWFCRWAMPALVVCALIVLIRVLTLGTPDASKPEQNVVNGLGYTWNPSVQSDWVAASDQEIPKLIIAYDDALLPVPRERVKGADGKPVEPPPSIDPVLATQGGLQVENKDAFVRALHLNKWQDDGDGFWSKRGSKLRVGLPDDGKVRVEHISFGRALLNPKMWLDAAGQIFFSLSVGFGVIMCYSSYLKKDDDIALSSLTACSGNQFCEVALGGMITIPAAFIFLGAAGAGAAAGSSFDLGFKTLPLVFKTMPLGQFVGCVFFFLLFLAAITSSLSMLQPAIALLEEGLGLGRKSSVTVLGFVTLMGTGFVVFFSKGLVALDTIDFWIGTFGIYTLATIQVLMFGWVIGVDKGFEELDRGASIRVPRIMKFIIKYVSPVYLLIVFACWIYSAAGDYVQAIANDRVVLASVVFCLVVMGFFMLLIAQSVRRWSRAELAAKEISP